MDDADAAHVAVQCVGEKLAQRMLGLSDAVSMQVQLGLDAILAAPELAQHRALRPGAVEHELVAGGQGGVVTPPGEAFLQDGMPVSARKARASHGCPTPRGWPVGGDRLDVPHRFAEETDVVVFGFGVHN